jgi:pilin isopeptide linkage protein
MVYSVAVTVTDAGGKLQAQYSVMNIAGSNIVFENTYKAEKTAYTLKGNKTLTGRVLINEEFTFVLREADENGTILADGLILQAKNFADGSFAFAEISYAAAGTYYYVVSERAGGSTDYGIHFDQTQYLVTVTVTDDLQGKLDVTDVSIRILGGEKVDSITFVNDYIPKPTQAQIPGKKTLTGKLLGGGDFQFQLHEADENWTRGQLLETVANGADGSFAFQTITYDTVGTWYYLVTEVNGGETIDGVTYDDTVYRVRIDITDDLVGQLHAAVHVYDDAGVPRESIEFYNVYTPDPDALELDITAVKTVVNTTEQEIGPEDFIFLLENVTLGTSMTARSDAEGLAAFRLIFTADDIGKTYTYKLSEVNDGREGVLYDTTVYNISIFITLDEDNTLRATILNNGAEVAEAVGAFENTYSPPDNPKTGDTRLSVWIAMMILSAGSVLTLTTWGKRKEKEV